jgi:hypothetical protein
MTKISNNFLIGTVNKDFDERLVPVGQLTDAENISILTGEEGQKGVVKNALGNLKKTDYATLYNITNAKTIGKCISSSEELIYNFVCGNNYDAIIEYNAKLNTSSIVLMSTNGGVLNFNKSYRIKGTDIVFTSEGEGNLLAWTDNYNPPRIINITRAKLFPVNGFTKEEISVIKAPPEYGPSTTLIITPNLDGANFMRDKFLSFAYRYKYNDGYYSALSSWSEYCFLPKQFDIDYDTGENEGMENACNSVDLTFNTGKRDVIGVDLVFKESGKNAIYIIHKFIKQEEGWADNLNQTFTFSENKIYSVLPQDQYFRNFDNVPLLAKAQTIAGNRLMYSNFTEGRDIDTVLDYDVELFSEPTAEEEPVISGSIDYNISKWNPINISNIIDFSTAPVSGFNRVDYSTNTFKVPASGTSKFWISEFEISLGATTKYDILVVNAVSGLVVTGEYNIEGSFNTLDPRSPIELSFYAIANATFYLVVQSTKSFSYTARISEIFYSSTGATYEVREQLSCTRFPGIKSHQGDVVPKSTLQINWSTTLFEKGSTFAFGFEFNSYLSIVPENYKYIFYYTLTDNYTNILDFYTRSNIKNRIEVIESNNFQTGGFLSGAGTLLSYVGFKTAVVGQVLYVDMPYALYDVPELDVPPDNLENKYEFFKGIDFQLKISKFGFFKSLHSGRDYEVAMIYMDAEGRKTTALIDSTNIVNIPSANSDYLNRIAVTTNHNPPSWADRYKFAIKQIKGDYETIYASSVYKDINLIHYYIPISNANKDKIKEGDLLIVKADSVAPLNTYITTKVLEVKYQEEGFELPTGGIAPAGYYFKVHPNGYSLLPIQPFVFFDEHCSFSPSTVSVTVSSIPTNYIITGSRIRIKIYSHEHGVGASYGFDETFTASNNYSTLKNWYDSEFPGLVGVDASNFQIYWGSPSLLYVDGSEAGYGYFDDGTRCLSLEVTVQKVNPLCFETMPIENESALFYETPNTYKVVNGLHNSGNILTPNYHLLTDAWNCFCWGNGIESYKIFDKFNANSLYIDFNPTAITEDRYRRINRFADITYSEVFQESTNVNRLNEFNLSLANYKDDIDKSFGPVETIKGFDTNLDVIQEDKYSVVFYGKDLLYNTDGSTNLQKIPEVLGQQKAYDGEYGSQHSDSFDFYGFNRYFADYKRGTVMVKTNNGLIPISEKGMNDYFTSLFRDNTIHNIIGEYDQYLDSYILNIQYGDNQYVTWLYSEENKGWTTRHPFNPEHIVRLNGDLYSFKNGEIYHHNHNGIYNTFYGVQTPSTVSFNMNIEPGTRKVFRTLSLEGTDSWDATVVTDLQSGYINSGDFLNKEGVKYAYIRGNDSTVDTATPSVQGIGIVSSISGNNVITGNSVTSLVSVGDKVYTSSMSLIGTITNILSNGVTLSSVVGLNLGDFILGVKPQEVETSGLLGYYMNVTLELDKNTKTELYEVNSEVSKSFM